MPSLEALLDSDIEVAAVVTNPDRPGGRGMRPRPSPVKTTADRAGIHVMQPERARDPSLRARLEALHPDVAAVVAYGSLLPRELLEVPRLGFVNVHFSLLPAYRGAAPVQRAVMDGATATGVSVMVLTEGMDEGPVLAAAATSVGARESAGEVGERLARTGAELLVATLPRYADGSLRPRPQDDERASYAPKVSAEEARVDWSAPARTVVDLVRGLDPTPGAWTTLRGRRLKVHRAVISGRRTLAPGRIGVAEDGLLAGAGDGDVRLEEVQLSGRRRLTGAELARGLRVGDDEWLV